MPIFEPPNAILVDVARALTQMIGRILDRDAWEVSQSFVDHVLHTSLHLQLQLVEPLLDLAIVLVRVNCLDQIDLLVLFTDELGDFVLVHLGVGSTYRSEMHLVDAFKALLKVLLNILWLLRLTKNLDEVLIGEEVEAREVLSLRLQVLVQVLCDVF